jgi:hypothetical protein
MAPKRISHKHYSKKVDMYSFGIVLWELVTRERKCEPAAGAHQPWVSPVLESQPVVGGGHRGAHGVGHHRPLLLLLRLGAPAAPPD